jgi:hypothetical protein
MLAWWSNLTLLSTFNNWMEVVALLSAALTLISVMLLWRNGSQMVSHLIDRESRASKRIKAVEKAAEQIRKELLTAQQHQDIVDQKRHVAEMDADAMRKEIDQMRKRYSAAEGALKERIDELKDFHITQGITVGGSTTTQPHGIPVKKSRLDAQQQQMLSKLLKTGPKGELDIISVLDDAVSHEAAVEFKTIFDEQGWDTQNIIQSAFSNPPEGIVLTLHSKQTAPSYAKFLQRTLTTIGLPVSAQINDKYREWSISMIVGKIETS